MKIKDLIIYTTDFISIIFLFILFIWIFMEMKCVSLIYDRIFNHIFAQKFQPIQDIILNRNFCPEEKMYPLLNYTFLGIADSCYNITEHTVKKGLCKVKDTNLINIPKINKKVFSIWRDKMLCAKFFEETIDKTKTFEFKDYIKNEKCSEGFKQCGHINRESINQRIHKIVCVKNNLECPLNFITMTENISEYTNSSEYQIHQFHKRYLVTSNKKISNSIVTKMRIAEGVFPCYEHSEYSNTTSQFPTMNKIYYYGCSSNDRNETDIPFVPDPMINFDYERSLLINQGYDVNYKKLDVIPKERVLKDNDLNIEYSNLPNLTNWQQDIYTGNFNLFYKDTYIFKDECHFDEYEDTIKNFKTIQAWKVLAITFNLILFILLTAYIIIRANAIKKDRTYYTAFWSRFLLGLLWIGFNVIIFNNFEYFEKMDKFDENLAACLDDVTKAILYNHDINLVMADYTKFFSKEKFYILIYLAFCLIKIIIQSVFHYRNKEVDNFINNNLKELNILSNDNDNLSNDNNINNNDEVDLNNNNNNDNDINNENININNLINNFNFNNSNN